MRAWEGRVWIHAFADGRDVSPHAAASDLALLPASMLATVVGRYYAMDRDNRDERTERAVSAMLDGVGEPASEAATAVAASYARGITDEFLEPIVVEGRPRIHPERDAAIFFNFRPDRGRQLSRRLIERGVDLTTMTRLRRGHRGTRRVPGAERHRHPRRDAEPGRRPPASCRRDREVRPRDVLLQRWRGVRVER